jgi:hypothetical protein
MRERSVSPPIVSIPRIPANSISAIGEFSSRSERGGQLEWGGQDSNLRSADYESRRNPCIEPNLVNAGLKTGPLLPVEMWTTPAREKDASGDRRPACRDEPAGRGGAGGSAQSRGGGEPRSLSRRR